MTEKGFRRVLYIILYRVRSKMVMRHKNADSGFKKSICAGYCLILGNFMTIEKFLSFNRLCINRPIHLTNDIYFIICSKVFTTYLRPKKLFLMIKSKKMI